MIEPPICPNCEGTNTERVAKMHSADEEETDHVYVCDDCPAQYTVTFRTTDKEIDTISNHD